MEAWGLILDMWTNVKEFFLGLSAEQIALVSVVVTLILFVAGQRSETKFKKHEVRRQEYKKFIEFLEKSLSGKLDVNDLENKSKFFDMGVSLFLYGSKRVYKKYLFFREYTTNPIVQKSKHHNSKVIIYVVADILSTIRHEVGLTSISELEPNEVMSFFVNDVGTSPLSRIDAYKARYSIFMIKCEIFFFNRYNLVTTKKLFYHWIKPTIVAIGELLKFLVMCIGKLLRLSHLKSNIEDKQEEKTTDKDGMALSSKKAGFVAGIALLITVIKDIWELFKPITLWIVIGYSIAVLIVFYLALGTKLCDSKLNSKKVAQFGDFLTVTSPLVFVLENLVIKCTGDNIDVGTQIGIIAILNANQG